MVRLPVPGQDDGTWGDLLNEFLAQSHTTTGALKSDVVNATTIQDGTISEALLNTAVQNKLNAVASGGVVSVNGHSGTVTLTKTDIGLGAADNTSDASKPVSTATQTALNGKAASVHTHAASDISDSTVTGRLLVSAADAAAARTAIGAGTSNLALGTTSTTAKAGNYAPTKSDVGLANADNTSDANKPISTATQTALDAKAADSAAVHKTGAETIAGIKTFSSSPVVPTPGAGPDAANKAYVDATASSGAPDASSSVKGLVQLTGDLGGTAASPTVPGLSGKQPLDSDLTTIAALVPPDNDILQRKSSAWVSRTPAQLKTDLSLTQSDVGLANVNNTSDANKPISTATQSALDAKAALSHTHTASNISDSTTTGRSVLTAADAAAARTAIGAGTSNLALGTSSTTAKAGDYVPTKADVGLGNADNTSDANKPISTLTQNALNLKADATTVGAKVLLINNAAALPAGTPAGVVVVVKA